MLANENSGNIVKILVHQYLKGSLLFSIEPEDAKFMTWINQKAFLDETIHSKLLKSFPVRNEFAKLFFKKLIRCIEPYQEVHDDIYNFLCSAMKNEGTDSFCYRHYIIDDNLQNIITIKETNNMVVNGTTGMRTWEAALMLADWAVCNKNIFLNKQVLELGSGVGFTGITIAKYCNIGSIVLSDYHDDVLKTIKDNIYINFPEFVNDVESSQQRDHKSTQTQQSNIDVMMLDWNDHDEIPKELVPDIILGADIVYDPSILQLLCNVLHNFFDKNDNLEVYIASMIRNEETFNEFLTTLEKNKLTFFKVSQDRNKFVEWDYSNKQRCILKIKT